MTARATLQDGQLPIIKSIVDVQGEVSSYENFHDNATSADRASAYERMVNSYYNLATDFYEWGWGQSFHFAPQAYTESFQTAIVRHEHYLALNLGLKKEWKILDVGCGVGGPARNIARLAGCKVVGLNNNQYQVNRASLLTERQGLTHRVSFVKGDFMQQPFANASFDAVYQIEATAHAPDKVKCYSEILRVLKPGQLFAGYEWCLTDKFDPENEKHLEIKKGIEKGNGLPDIATTNQVDDALQQAGFEILETFDMASNCNTEFEMQWYTYLTAGLSPTRIQFYPFARNIMWKFLDTLEAVKIVPKGTRGVSQVLNVGADALASGGKLGIFTPMYFHLARKPLHDE